MWWFFSKTGFCHQFVVYKKQLRLTYSATTWSRELLYYLFKNFAMTFTESDSPVYTLQLIYNTVYNRFVFYLLRTICFYLLQLYNKKDSSVIKLRIWRGNERFIRKKYFECISIFQEIFLNTYRYILIGESTSLAPPRLHFMMQWKSRKIVWMKKYSHREHLLTYRLSLQQWVSQWGVPRLETIKLTLDTTMQEFGNKMSRWIGNRNNTTQWGVQEDLQ